jgi:hypothetical protein
MEYRMITHEQLELIIKTIEKGFNQNPFLPVVLAGVFAIFTTIIGAVLTYYINRRNARKKLLTALHAEIDTNLIILLKLFSLIEDNYDSRLEVSELPNEFTINIFDSNTEVLGNLEKELLINTISFYEGLRSILYRRGLALNKKESRELKIAYWIEVTRVLSAGIDLASALDKKTSSSISLGNLYETKKGIVKHTFFKLIAELKEPYFWNFVPKHVAYNHD